jgi:hypothetical protein
MTLATVALTLAAFHGNWTLCPEGIIIFRHSLPVTGCVRIHVPYSDRLLAREGLKLGRVRGSHAPVLAWADPADGRIAGITVTRPCLFYEVEESSQRELAGTVTGCDGAGGRFIGRRQPRGGH